MRVESLPSVAAAACRAVALCEGLVSAAQTSSSVVAAVSAAQSKHARDTPATTVRPRGFALFLVPLLAFLLSSCATKDTDHHVLISARDQKMALLEKGRVIAVYPVSTSKFGLGDEQRSYRTPLGEMEVASKIGDNAPLGTVFKDRRRTGEIVAVNAPGRDPIVTRIIWLRGREPQNAHAFARDIYIHGTPEERNIGKPASYGCIRMRSADIVDLYSIVGSGARVTLLNAPIASMVEGLTNAPGIAAAALKEDHVANR